MLASVRRWKDAVRRSLPRRGRAPRSPYFLREFLAGMHLGGGGLEVGALHHPLPLPPSARVRYVDRLDEAGLRAHYPELAGVPFAPVDLVDDGEKLSRVAPGSQDFVVANHLLEHAQDPVGTVKRFLEVLKPGGVLYLAVPDKRGTFDARRPLTTREHLHRDHREGPAWSYLGHLREYAELVDGLSGDALEERVRFLAEIDYRIHFHVWTQATFWEFVVDLRASFGLAFEVLAFVANPPLSETICVLRKG
ncbi:MAG TPA: methyltransferase domain-containing protein [Gemmataceae bacterium]|nr:methyltransferase domain-containing protein [Gemmataceae bacterium]